MLPEIPADGSRRLDSIFLFCFRSRHVEPSHPDTNRLNRPDGVRPSAFQFVIGGVCHEGILRRQQTGWSSAA